MEYVFLFSLQPFSETFFILRKIQLYITINILVSSCKILVLVRF